MFHLYKCALLDAYPIVCVERSWSALCRTWRHQCHHLHFFLTVEQLKNSLINCCRLTQSHDKGAYSTNFCFYLAWYLYVEIDFGVQKTDKFIINGMAGSVGHIAINCWNVCRQISGQSERSWYAQCVQPYTCRRHCKLAKSAWGKTSQHWLSLKWVMLGIPVRGRMMSQELLYMSRAHHNLSSLQHSQH